MPTNSAQWPAANAWDKQWYGPVAAIRPYLFQKCFLLLLTCDVFVLMLERGCRYGLDRIPFNVAHFRSIDVVHQVILPAGVPSATYYVCVLVLVGYLASILFIVGHRPGWTALLAILYTYGWSMSRLDSYLHHYMISVILGCLVFFPRVSAEPVLFWSNQHRSSTKSHRQVVDRPRLAIWAVWLAVLAVAYRVALSGPIQLSTSQRWMAMFLAAAIAAVLVFRWQGSLPDGNGPLITAWAFRLLGTTIGVIYVFTSVAKMDQEWCGGHTLRQVGTTPQVLAPIERMVGAVGVPADLFWAILATTVIPLELTIALSYWLAVWQDVPHRIWLRRWSLAAWVMAIALHLNNEMMNLVIQWFGYHMMFLASMFLLPARVLLVVGSVPLTVEVTIRKRYRAYVDSLPRSSATLLLGITAGFALFVVILSGFFLAIPGAIVAACLITVTVVVLLVSGMVWNWEREVLIVPFSVAAAGMLTMGIVAQCTARFDYYDLRGKTLQQLGDHAQAVIEMERALAFPAKPSAIAELHTNLGLSYRSLGEPARAEACYHKSLDFDPAAFLAHYNLGNMLLEQNRLNDAESHFRRAIAIKSDFSDAYVNLGALLEFSDRVDEAIECYRLALAVEPNASDIQQMLQTAASK